MGPVVAELLASSPDVVVAFSNLCRSSCLKGRWTGNIPIVFVGVGDPIGDGIVSSLAHPGGTITGFTSHDASMGGKWLEMLKEGCPSLWLALWRSCMQKRLSTGRFGNLWRMQRPNLGSRRHLLLYTAQPKSRTP